MDDSTLAILLNEKENYRDHRDNRGMSATGIGLAAGLGGGALLLAIAGLWGVNKASEARSIGALAGIAANTATLGSLNNNLLAERTSREGWQAANMPSVQSYIDIRQNQSQNTQSTASAVADAFALAAAINNNGGLNNAIGTDSFLRVQRYSAPQPCGCDTCGCGN